VPTHSAPFLSRRMLQIRSEGRPCALVQASHSPWPIQRATPAPTRATHSDPSRSSKTAVVTAVRSPRRSSTTVQFPPRLTANPSSVGTIIDPSRPWPKAPKYMLDASSGLSRITRASPGGFRYSKLGLRIQTEPSGVMVIASHASSGRPSAGPKIETLPRSSTQSSRPQSNHN
jgi:hypothetical protein